MSAIATITGCLASIAIGASLVSALSQVENSRSATWRHRVGSAAFWSVAILPLAFSLSTHLFPTERDFAWYATVGRALPEALPAQEWLTQAARALLAAWVLWALVCTVRFSLRLRLTLATTAALRSVNGQHSEVVAADVLGPMLVGYRQPLVVLPSSAFAHSPAVLLAIERHERTHAVRHDNWRLLAERLALAALPWCGPLRRLHEKVLAAREELCDGVALKDADDVTRHAYAQALLDTLRRTSGDASGTSAMSGSLSAVSRRICAILQEMPAGQRISKRQRASACIAALACLTVTLLTPTLGSGLETIAGVRGLSLQFAPLPGGPDGAYRVTTLGGTPATSRVTPGPGNYRVTFARNAHGKWVVTAKPVPHKP